VKLGLLCGLVAVPACLLSLVACEGSNYSPVFVEGCEGGTDATPPKELVCAADFCGNIVDKATGATADCGSCQGYSQCGDNGKANVCGSSCMPLMKSPAGTAFCDDAGAGCTPYFTNACDLAFGPGWNAGYGVGMQFPASCSYMDPNNCVAITNPWPANGECSGEVCGSFYCCVDNPDAGYNPLLPGAVAGNDGGLP
jgi:hypothetical protein